MERRLNRVDTLARRRAPAAAPQARDLDRLDASERDELFAITAKLQGLPPQWNGWADLGPLSDGELDRLAELTAKLEGVEVA